MQAKKYFLKSQNFFEKIIEFKNSFKIEMLVPGTSSRKVLGILLVRTHMKTGFQNGFPRYKI